MMQVYRTLSTHFPVVHSSPTDRELVLIHSCTVQSAHVCVYVFSLGREGGNLINRNNTGDVINIYLVVTKIRNGTERNGTVPPTNARNGTTGTAQCNALTFMVRKRLGTTQFLESSPDPESDP